MAVAANPSHSYKITGSSREISFFFAPKSSRLFSGARVGKLRTSCERSASVWPHRRWQFDTLEPCTLLFVWWLLIWTARCWPLLRRL
jgi:hypothetical protein